MIRNAIVIMFDSLQYNYLGCYGNEWIKTPNFDRLAREGVLFENCYIEGLPTVPCRRAMHTGRYTLPVNGWVALSMEDTTIADLCWGRPIDTAIIFDAPPCRLPKFGYTRGFDKVWFFHGSELDQEFYAQDPLYHLKPEDYHEESLLQNCDAVQGGTVVKHLLEETAAYLKQGQYWRSEQDQRPVRLFDKALEYLRQVDRNKSFYLWIDCFDPHEPWDAASVYDPDTPCPYDPDYRGKDQFLPIIGEILGLYTEEELHHIRMLYAEKITQCDTNLGRFLDGVRAMGFEENTLILQVSDHGEPMGNGEHGHGIMRKCRPWPYEELVHAPMIMRGPGIPAGKRVAGFVQSVDVAPTVCDWLGIGVHPDMQGKSLLPLARGEVDKVRDFAIAGYYKYSWSIITEDWSYIHWPHKIRNDVYALHDIIASEMIKSAEHLSRMGGKGAMADASNEFLETEAFRRHQEMYSADGEDQWTCTPGSIANVPEEDELYNRHTDRKQLHNVAKDHPEVGIRLLEQLKQYMAELRAS